MKKVKTLIVGAGVTGLTYAAFSNEDYLIVEKESAPGGLCRTFYEKGYVWDFAGHFFHFSTETIKQFFEQEIPKEQLVRCEKNTKIYYKDRLIDYPFQMNIHQLPKQEFIDCLYDLFNRNQKEQYSNFEEMLYGKFGESITNKFLKPYNEKLYACLLETLDTNAMGRFFPYAQPIDIINNMKRQCTATYNSSFQYPKKGAIAFVNVLLKKISPRRILFNSTLEKIYLPDKKAIVNGEIVEYDKLICTIPLNHFVELVQGPSLNELKESLHANKVLVFNLGFDKKSIDSKVHWIYFPDKKVNFYRVGFYDNILGQDKMSLYVEIGFKQGEEIDVEKQLSTTLDNLKKCGIITDHELVAHNTLIIDPAYVHITEESQKNVQNFKRTLAEAGIYLAGRYGEWTYCSIEDCMIAAYNLVQNEKNTASFQ